MKYTELGNSGIEVSRICLGCMGFGNAEAGFHKWTLPYEDTKKIIDYAVEQGITFFDTAMAYQGGTSEEFVGKALKDVRNKVVIATKYTPRFGEMLNQYSGTEWINKCIDDSLTRLGTDHIDLYIMHSWDYNTPVLESLQALDAAKKAGKIRAIGISNCWAWLLTKVTSPFVGATKVSHIDGAVGAVNLELSEEEIKYLEEPYVPHAVVGVLGTSVWKKQAE